MSMHRLTAFARKRFQKVINSKLALSKGSLKMALAFRSWLQNELLFWVVMIRIPYILNAVSVYEVRYGPLIIYVVV